MRHCKRKTLTTEDVTNALKHYGEKPIYGCASEPHSSGLTHVPEADVFVANDAELDLSTVTHEASTLNLNCTEDAVDIQGGLLIWEHNPKNQLTQHACVAF